MKRLKALAATLCAVACITSTAFAEEDSGLVSATPSAPAIADPINPQPGMIFSAYGFYNWMKDREKITGALAESLSNLKDAPALKTGVDKNDKFVVDCADGVLPYAIRWEGFLKSKLTKTYTFLIQKPFKESVTGDRWYWGYAIRINGKSVCVAYGEEAFDAALKIGFNKVEIITLLPRFTNWDDCLKSPLLIWAKPKGSIIEPVPLSPKMMFFDNVPELNEPGL